MLTKDHFKDRNVHPHGFTIFIKLFSYNIPRKFKYSNQQGLISAMERKLGEDGLNMLSSSLIVLYLLFLTFVYNLSNYIG